MLRFGLHWATKRIPSSLIRARPLTTTVAEAESTAAASSSNPSAHDAYQRSCYMKIDFTVKDDHSVMEAVTKMCAYNCGCLVTTNEEGKMT
jgi:predicted transcriptional regulator